MMLKQRQGGDGISIETIPLVDNPSQKEVRSLKEDGNPKEDKVTNKILNRPLSVAPISTEGIISSKEGRDISNAGVSMLSSSVASVGHQISLPVPHLNLSGESSSTSIQPPFNTPNVFPHHRLTEEEPSVHKDTFIALHQQFELAQQEFYSPEVQNKLSNCETVPGIRSVLEMVACASGAFMAEQMARLKACNFSFSDSSMQYPLSRSSAFLVGHPFDRDSNFVGLSGLKRKRTGLIGEDMKNEILSSSLAHSHLTNTNKCSLIDRALFTQIEATIGPLGAAFASYLNTDEGKMVLEAETGRTHGQWVQTFSPSDSLSGFVPLITSSMLEANAEGIKLQETLSKRWGYLAKTARDVIRDIRSGENVKLWAQQYEKAYEEFGDSAKELVEAGASGNWGMEDTDPYFDKDATSRSSPEAIKAARILRRIIAGAFSAQYAIGTDFGLHRSVQYVLAAVDSLPVRFSGDILMREGGAPRAEVLRHLWSALAAGFFQKAKLQYTELNPIGHSLIYLSLDAAIRGCNMTERSHLTCHVRVLSNLYAATIAAESNSNYPLNESAFSNNSGINGVNMLTAPKAKSANLQENAHTEGK